MNSIKLLFKNNIEILLYNHVNVSVTIMLQQAALTSCFVKQQPSNCCCKLLTVAVMTWRRQQLLYTAQLSLLYLLFMLLVLVNYTHMTCLYAGPDITKSIHRHQRCKRHTGKSTMHVHRIASQLHLEKPRVKFYLPPFAVGNHDKHFSPSPSSSFYYAWPIKNVIISGRFRCDGVSRRYDDSLRRRVVRAS